MIKRKYKYSAMYDNGNTPNYIDKDNYLNNKNGRNSDKPILTSWHNHKLGSRLFLDNSILIDSVYDLIYPDEKIICISGRKKSPNVYFCFNSVNNKCYAFFHNTSNPLANKCYSDQPDMAVYEVKLDELPDYDRNIYKFVWVNNGVLFITMKGNVYFKPYLVNNVEQPLFKVNISNITDIVGHLNGNYLFLNKDNHLLHGWVSTPQFFISSDPVATDFTYHYSCNNASLFVYIVKDNPKKMHMLNFNGEELGSHEFEYNIVNIHLQGELFVLLENGQCFSMSISLNPDTELYQFTGKLELTIDMDNYKYDFVYEHPTFITLDIDAYSYEYTPSSTNITYKYRFRLKQNISNDASRNVVNYVTN